MSELKYCYKYPHPAVTTDCVIFGFDGIELKILLIKRKFDPYRDKWAFPGGFLNPDEPAEIGALRELEEETCLKKAYIEQLYTFTDPDRDPRERIITTAYFALVKLQDVKGRDDATEARWFSLNELPELAFDHKEIFQMALNKLRERICFNPAGYHFISDRFTIKELQALYKILIKDKSEFDTLVNLLKADRSYRRFDESYYIDKDILLKIIDLTRFCASARNLQPIKYFIVNDVETCNKIFPLLKWAGYLSDWDGPEIGERPTAYLIQCLDTSLTKNCLCDDGLQLQTITMGSVAQNLGCCIIKSFDSIKLKEILDLKDNFDPLYVVAVGKPIEEIVIEDFKNSDSNSIKYYRTSDGIHHVPKRILNDVVINI